MSIDGSQEKNKIRLCSDSNQGKTLSYERCLYAEQYRLFVSFLRQERPELLDMMTVSGQAKNPKYYI